MLGCPSAQPVGQRVRLVANLECVHRAPLNETLTFRLQRLLSQEREHLGLPVLQHGAFATC